MPRGRQPNPNKSIERKIQFPERLDTELQLLLYSEVEQRVPYGALSRLVVPVMEQFLTKLKEERKRGTGAEQTHRGWAAGMVQEETGTIAGSGLPTLPGTAAGSEAADGRNRQGEGSAVPGNL